MSTDANQPDVNDNEKHKILDYIGHMSLELAGLAERAEASDISEALRLASSKALERIGPGAQAST